MALNVTSLYLWAGMALNVQERPVIVYEGWVSITYVKESYKMEKNIYFFL